MLKSSDLVIQSELEMYKAVEKWLLSLLDTSGSEVFLELSQKLLPLIRFPMMPIVDLHEVRDTVML